MTAFRMFAAAAIAFGCSSSVLAEPRPPFPQEVRPDLRWRLPAAALCEGLRDLTWEDGSRIVSAAVVPYNATTRVPRHCAVRGIATPTSDSIITFEVWIPFDGRSYRNRYLQLGNGGFSGGIPHDQLRYGVQRGYAAAATDDGNQVLQSPAFVVGHPEKVIDYGHRSLKQTNDKAKDVIAALMGARPERSYFEGCSNGGRQALMVAQRYPADFDGIIAGAPANYFTHQFASFAWNAQKIYAPGSVTSRLRPSSVSILSNEVRRQCAGRDGGLATDRYLTNPLLCRVNLGPITCAAGASTASCLTPAEAGIVRDLYAGPMHATTGEQIFPGLEPGAEDHAGNWGPWITGPVGASPFGLQALYGSGFFGAFVNNTTAPFDVRPMDVSAAIDVADARFAEVLNSTDGDLRAFHDRGGKLIQYHGFDDAAVAPKNSINTWASVAARMRSVRPGFMGANLNGFYRLFMVPGLGHCFGGDGANVLLGDPVTGARLDAGHDLYAAIERWVEAGEAPSRLIASHLEGAAVTFQRPVCAYPTMPAFRLGQRGRRRELELPGGEARPVQAEAVSREAVQAAGAARPFAAA
jgi:Tannase and feruloyl esterase